MRGRPSAAWASGGWGLDCRGALLEAPVFRRLGLAEPWDCGGSAWAASAENR